METETVSSRNIVDLLLKEEFNSGICGTHTSEANSTGKQDEANYVYGWDC
jgi:prenylcysteine oxidase/farnesylcysteine lyase